MRQKCGNMPFHGHEQRNEPSWEKNRAHLLDVAQPAGYWEVGRAGGVQK
jgi:hypothetical protein